MVEAQDEGSQLAAPFNVKPGEQIDLCAGAGGKTLAMAAMMNKGQFATTTTSGGWHPSMMAQAFWRPQRQVHAQIRRMAKSATRSGWIQLIDAPCTGTAPGGGS